MAIRKVDTPEELLCQVCPELSEMEIYRCKEVHGPCGVCITSIQNSLNVHPVCSVELACIT